MAVYLGAVAGVTAMMLVPPPPLARPTNDDGETPPASPTPRAPESNNNAFSSCGGIPIIIAEPTDTDVEQRGAATYGQDETATTVTGQAPITWPNTTNENEQPPAVRLPPTSNINGGEIPPEPIQQTQILNTNDPPSSPCDICGGDGDIVCSSEHGFCEECFNNYARIAFQAGGAFCREITNSHNNGGGNVHTSPSGALPCPFFQHGQCQCSTILPAQFSKTLNNETIQLWTQAIGRLAVQQSEKEAEEQAARLAEIERLEQERLNDRRLAARERRRSDQRAMDQLVRQAVETIMYLGASVACPSCKYRGEKNEACMHITCENQTCRHKWCYCCGRSRARWPNKCNTCDRDQVFLENCPGWGELAAEPREGRGMAALHEFHRRRIAYFLRRLQEALPHFPWEQFWNRNSELLVQVPTPNRQITREEISSAQPPVFPPTQTRHLAWLNDVNPAIRELKLQLTRRGWLSGIPGAEANDDVADLVDSVNGVDPEADNENGDRAIETIAIEANSQIQQILESEAIDEATKEALVESVLYEQSRMVATIQQEEQQQQQRGNEEQQQQWRNTEQEDERQTLDLAFGRVVIEDIEGIMEENSPDLDNDHDDELLQAMAQSLAQSMAEDAERRRVAMAAARVEPEDILPPAQERDSGGAGVRRLFRRLRGRRANV